MERNWPAVVLALSLLFVLASSALANEMDERVREVAKRLECPVCESVTVADSPSDLAAQMRGTIRTKLEAGETEPQIIQYFVERYGEQILVEPPRHGLALAVWTLPVLVLVGGGVGLVLLLRGWTRRTPTAGAQIVAPLSGLDSPATAGTSYANLARLELERVRRELDR